MASRRPERRQRHCEANHHNSRGVTPRCTTRHSNLSRVDCLLLASTTLEPSRRASDPQPTILRHTFRRLHGLLLRTKPHVNDVLVRRGRRVTVRTNPTTSNRSLLTKHTHLRLQLGNTPQLLNNNVRCQVPLLIYATSLPLNGKSIHLP